MVAVLMLMVSVNDPLTVVCITIVMAALTLLTQCKQALKLMFIDETVSDYFFYFSRENGRCYL